MSTIETALQAAGSVALFLYGAKTLSRGTAQAAERGLRSLLDPMGASPVPPIPAGIAAAAALQSSRTVASLLGAFAEAGILPLSRVVGAVLGACVGSSAQTWIAAAALSSLRFPRFAVGSLAFAYFLPRIARWRNRGAGEALAGFALLALGLSFFLSALDAVDRETLGRGLAALPLFAARPAVLAAAAGFGIGSLSRSAGTGAAFALAFGYGGFIDFGVCAAMVLGARGGAAARETLRVGSDRSSRGRAIAVHALASGAGLLGGAALLAVLPAPRLGGALLCFAVAAFDTLSAALGVLAVLPAAGRLADEAPLAEASDGDRAPAYRLSYIGSSLRDSPELNILRAEHELRLLSRLAERMFERFRTALAPASDGKGLEAEAERSREDEAAADSMRETLSRFLVECAGRVPGEAEGNRVGHLIRVAGELEDMTDDCNALIRIAAKAAAKGIKIDKPLRDLLAPYLLLLRDFLAFIRVHIGSRGSDEAFERAKGLEATINGMRDELKKGAGKRLRSGADARTELVFLDIVRRVEKLGDHAYAIAGELRQLR
jgi:phosphate:Na+ symporter